MSESILKKEFVESDLQRMRNLVTKKFGDSTKVQVGYKKEIIDRIEGEIWEENGKKWTIKNGIKSNIGKLDTIREQLHFPLICPNCNKPMNVKLDKKFYFYHKQCFNCVIDMEHKLRVEGKWEDYQNKYINISTNQALIELEQEIEDFLNSTDSFVTEQGDVESWSTNNDKDKIRNEIKEYIKNIKSKLTI